MIYWNEQLNGWAFDQITDLEREKIMDLGLKTVMPGIAAAVVSKLFGSVEPVHDADSEFDWDTVDPETVGRA